LYTDIVEEKIQELSSMLSEFDIEWLRQYYRKKGHDAWAEWFFHNKKEIEDFVLSLPANRASRKKWRNPTLRRQLIFFGVYVLKRAIPLLNAYSTLDQFRNCLMLPKCELLWTIYRLSYNDYVTYVEYWWIDDDSPFD